MEIQTLKRLRKANFAESEVRVLSEEVAAERATLFTANLQATLNTVTNEAWRKITT